MTKYLLNSGGIGNSADHGQRFFRSIVDGLGAKPKVLFCFFARPREDWEASHLKYTKGFAACMPKGVEPQFTMAMPESFARQVAENDAVYIFGGDDHLLQYWLKQYDLVALWQGKIVATSSASSHALATHFWTCDWRQCMDGLGILSIKFLAHYQSQYGIDDPRGPIDWIAAKKKLEAFGDTNLPVFALHEGDFEVFEA